MTQIHLIPAAACHMAAACALYNEAFPPEERRPWDTIVNPVSAAGPHLYIAADADGRNYGFVTIWTFPKFIYVEHLAVDAAARGAGIGA